jgi:hypothetical protein
MFGRRTGRHPESSEIIVLKKMDKRHMQKMMHSVTEDKNRRLPKIFGDDGEWRETHNSPLTDDDDV